MDVTPPLAAARGSLAVVVQVLEALQAWMEEIRATLPTHPRREDPEESDAAADLRIVITCVLRDWIGPAIRDLRDVLVETAPVEES